MIVDPQLRAFIAYGLIALLMLAAVTATWLRRRNTWRRRGARASERLTKFYRQRDQDAAAAALKS